MKNFTDTNQTIIDLFEASAVKTPDHTAILTATRQLSYQDVQLLTSQLASYLRYKHGVQAGEPVAVQLPRSEYLPISFLGIMKAGAVYLPLGKDPLARRVEYIRNDSQFKVLIDTAFIERFEQEKDQYPVERSLATGNSIAYIIYTSGTTGQPKGTLIRHDALVNRLSWMNKQYQLTPSDTILQKTTCTFDVSVWELLWWGLSGAKVFMLEDGLEKDPEQLIQTIQKYNITVLHFVPSMLARFLDFVESDHQMASLQRVYASGEALSVTLNNRYHELFKTTQLVNLYGPTEATIDVTCFECKPGLDIIPIGKPIDNTLVYILDNELQEVAEGTLYLSGIQLATGYLNKPELTKEKFIPDPFHPGETMYNTGDTARWLPDGNIEYLGRNDEQVKIRGFRIEPAEISYQLEQLPGINTAHVIKIDEKLVAFLLLDAPKAGPLKDNYKDSLAEVLPEYMIPHHFFGITEVPLSSSGKTDKKQLIALYNSAPNIVETNTLSGTALEMAQAWATVLNIPVQNIDPSRSFVEYGGDSLSMLKIVAIFKKKGHKLSIKDFLRHPYVNILEHSEKKTVVAAASLTSDKTTFLLSPIQQFFFDNNKQELNFLMHAAYYLQPSFSLPIADQLLEEVTGHHDAFSLRFKKEKGTWMQYYDRSSPKYKLEIIDTSITVQQCIEKAHAAIHIEKGPLVYASIFIENARPIFFLACHHLVMDAVSWKLFIDDLLASFSNTQIPAVAAIHKEADYANI